MDWMRKLAFRYRRVKELYNTYKNNVGGILHLFFLDLINMAPYYQQIFLQEHYMYYYLVVYSIVFVGQYNCVPIWDKVPIILYLAVVLASH